MMRWIAHAVAAQLLLAGTALAQQAPMPVAREEFAATGRSTHQLVLSNALIGGVSAAVRAMAGDADPVRAFVQGSFGGVLHFAGKSLATRNGAAMGLVGLATSAVGTSVVANAGRGAWLLEEVDIPLGPARLRVTPRAERRLRARLNAYDAVVTAWIAGRWGQFDWGESVRRGVLVFRDRDFIRVGNVRADGMAFGPIAVYTVLADDPHRTIRHEQVHVHQHWYSQAVWGADIDRRMRPLRAFAWLPDWVDLGVGGPALVQMERLLLGDAGYAGWREFEASELATPVHRVTFERRDLPAWAVFR